MNLPDFFLADLPPDAELSSAVLEQACETLLANRARYLWPRTTRSLVQTLGVLGEKWLDPAYPIRKLALAAGPKETGFSEPVLRNGLEGFFRGLSVAALEALIEQDLGSLQRLDGMCAGEPERRTGRVSLVVAPDLILHIAAGAIPNGTFTSIVLGLLLRSAQVVKCASGQAFLARLFAHSIYEHDPKLGSCLEIAAWPGGRADLAEAVYRRAACVTAAGSDETITAVRRALPAGSRFVPYGHRVSFGYVAAGSLSGVEVRAAVAQAALDVAAWDQLGCLSPHAIYVESGGVLEPDQFAGLLAAELQALEARLPRGAIGLREAATIRSRRAFYEVRAAHSAETRLWSSEGSTAWTVVYEAAPLFQCSCLNRFIYVKSVKDLGEALRAADAVRGKVSTVGLAAGEDKVQNLAEELARWGVTRVCPLGRMQAPPLAWRHDGRPALGELVTWADLEIG